jgi:hypothetical protein
MSIYHEFKSLGIEIIENKYFKWYCQIVEYRLNHQSTDSYTESHHYVPDCVGGEKTVILSSREHFIVHLLLTRFTVRRLKYQMIHALLIFKGNSKRYSNSRLYELNKTEHSRYKCYRNLDDGEYEWFDNVPGDGWIAESKSKGRQWWFNPTTSNKTMSHSCPGDDWILQGNTTGMKTYNNGKRITRSHTHPGDGWCEGGLIKGTTGINNTNFSCYYVLNDMKFESGAEMAKYTGMSETTCRRVCKNYRDDEITLRHIANNKYLQSLTFDPIGMTWGQLGFSFEDVK